MSRSGATATSSVVAGDVGFRATAKLNSTTEIRREAVICGTAFGIIRAQDLLGAVPGTTRCDSARLGSRSAPEPIREKSVRPVRPFSYSNRGAEKTSARAGKKSSKRKNCFYVGPAGPGPLTEPLGFRRRPERSVIQGTRGRGEPVMAMMEKKCSGSSPGRSAIHRVATTESVASTSRQSSPLTLPACWRGRRARTRGDA